MAVDISELVEALKGRVSPPGTNLYPNSTDEDWEARLTDAFWDGKLNGMTVFSSYTENAAARGGPASFREGIITPIGAEEGYDDPDGWSDDDLAREYQQLIVVIAAWRVTLAKFQDIKTQFKAKAGPVEFEKQQSASVLAKVLDALKAEIDQIRKNLSSYGMTNAVVFDAVIERTCAMYDQEVWWVR